MLKYAPRPSHPSRNNSERRVLDAIGRGNQTPRMAARTRDALLEAKLILPAGTAIRRDPSGEHTVPAYDMPLSVWAGWSNAVQATDLEWASIQSVVSDGFDRLDEFNKRFDDV